VPSTAASNWSRHRGARLGAALAYYSVQLINFLVSRGVLSLLFAMLFK
jgi:hypothetical protein